MFSKCGDGGPHRWRLAVPNGPVTDAVCLNCGAERQYSNVFLSDQPFNPEPRGTTGWHRDQAAERKARKP